MKKLFLFLGVTLSALTGVHAQDATKADGDVTLEMTDGTVKRGWSRTDMVNEVKFFEISAEPKGQRTRYDNDQIKRIVFDDGATFVKRDVHSRTLFNKDKIDKGRWVRVEYTGNGIALYSAYSEGWEQAGNVRRRVQQRAYFIALGSDDPVWASTDYLSGGTINKAGSNRAMLKYFFTKVYPQYEDFAKRIDDKEFDTKGSPIEVVRAWEQAYGGK